MGMNNEIKALYEADGEGKKIFELVQKKGPLSKNEIAEDSKVKLSTLARIMDPLVNSGLIVQSKIGESSGGRKPVLFDVNLRKIFIAGVDISRTYTRIIIADLKLHVLYASQFEMSRECNPQKTVELISEGLNAGLSKLNITKEMLVGIGVGTVGPLDRKKGVILNPVNFEAQGWVNVPIKDLIGEKMQLPVAIDNGANTAVLAETLFGYGKGIRNVAYFNCGVGIRTGVISSGRIVRAINDNEDAFGHMTIEIDGRRCSCGKSGCIEAYSSINSIVERYTAESMKIELPQGKAALKQINHVDICHASEVENGLASDIIRSSAHVFGVGLANFMNLLNPGLIILHGPLIMNSNLFYRICTEQALKNSYLFGSRSTLFSKGGYFGENAIAAGASALVIENILDISTIG